MELVYITSALRRYWWLVVAFVVVAVTAAASLSGRGPVVFRSEAVLLAAPPSESQFTVSFAGDPDRYVSSQLSVLRSQVMAERVADQLDDGSSGKVVRSVITVSHEPGTDVITIAADSSDPQYAQAVANAYLVVYFDSLRSQLEEAQAPLLEEIESEIEELNEEIARVDAAMAETMAPFLARDPIPSVDQVAPGLLSEKSVLLNQLNDLHQSRTQLRAGPRIASAVVQEATLPDEPLPSLRRVVLAIGAVGGLFAGIVAAVTMARFSPNVVTDDQVEEILEQPLVGHFPSLGLARTRTALLDPVPEGARRPIEALAVRAGSTNPSGIPVLSVVVAGTQRRAGTTTVASVIARNFVESGARVLLVDADRQDPELTRLFVAGRESVERSSSGSQAGVGGEKGRRPAATRVAMVPTAVPELYVSDLDRVSGRNRPRANQGTTSTAARRLDVEVLLESLPSYIDVVVFDGGPLLGAVSTLQLARHCNAVILTMPRRQSIRGLEVVAAEMGDRSFLPVWTPATVRTNLRRFAPAELPSQNVP